MVMKNEKTLQIGIIGQGFVGNAVFQKFKNYYDILTYDLDISKSNSNRENLIEKSDIIFTCLPTPMNSDGSCNISIVENVLMEINEVAHQKKIVVIKSTIPPKTTATFNQKYNNLDIVFNPEFLTERNAVSDYENQNRIILGGPRPATTILKQIFSKVFPNAHIIKTDSTHAEMVKYLTNTFLSVKVSFANEIYQVCQSLNIDYDKVVEYATLDERLGNSHWSVPGPDGDFGFGGHCFPKDLSALIHLTNQLGTLNNVLGATIETNNMVRTDRDWEGMKGRAVS
jgi:nucleotide sugar dehydrogenase